MSTAVENVEEEQNEVLLGVETNAIIDPRTVVIHLGYASLTDRAMMRVRWLD